MARILVLYGTTNGHTARIARSVADTLRQHGGNVDVIEAGTGHPRPEDYAAVVVAASVNAGKYQRPVRRWVGAHAEGLNGRPTAFISVCLGVLQQTPPVQQEVAAIMTRFLTAAGWRPAMTRTVAGALLYTRYTPITRWLMKRIARQAGGDTDTSRDYEYTDWADLRAFASAFAERVQREVPDAAGPPAHRARVA